MLLELLNRREEIFSIDFLEKYNMSPDNYVKEYKKELKLLKK